MKIEDLMLFENYNELKDEVTDLIRFHPQEFSAAYREFKGHTQGNDFQNMHPVDVYKQLIKMNIRFTPMFQDSGKIAANLRRDPEVLHDFFRVLNNKLMEVVERMDNKKSKTDYQILEKTGTYIVFEVFSEAASCRLGSNTKWCISSRGLDNYFNAYKQNSDVYIIHTRNDKYAIVVETRTRKIIELQTSDNQYGTPNSEIKNEFSEKLTRDGADVSRIEKLLNIEIGVEKGKGVSVAIDVLHQMNRESNGRMYQEAALRSGGSINGIEQEVEDIMDEVYSRVTRSGQRLNDEDLRKLSKLVTSFIKREI